MIYGEFMDLKKLIKLWRKEIFFGIGIFSLALILRLAKVLFDQQPIFGDEAIYIRWAQIMRAEPTLRFIPLSDGKQPLYMWAIIPLLKLISNPLFAGRIMSVFTGMGSLVGVFVLTQILFRSTKASLLASLVYAISPFVVFFDSMALVDSMLTMFGIWTLVFSVLSVKALRLDFAMIAGFFLGGAMLTKSPAVFFSILLPLDLLFLNLAKDKGKKAIILIKFLILLMVTYLIAFGLYNILRLGPNFHLIALRNQDYIFPLSHLWINPKDPFIFHIKEIFQWLWILGPSVLPLLVAIGIILRFNKFKKEIFLLSFWILLPLLANAMYAKVFTVRYILFVLPYLFIFVGVLFKNDLKKSFITLLLAIFIVHALIIDLTLITKIEAAPLPRNERSGYLEEWTAGYGIKETAKYLEEYHKDNPDKKIVVGTEGYFGTLPDGLQMYLSRFPEITVIGVGLDLNQLPSSLIESKKAGNSTFLVINDSRLRVNYEDLDLKVVAAYPKAFRKVGTKEYNTLGPRETLYLFEVIGDKNTDKK
ncbi:hypothetical protein A2962_03330 [Candidatus Woesebacteria bacterium RIFCSPLOWO2_01_FULL_39_61]|uniref:Glycosyltransferase RgtA/B/C/D-like domain-containing protein n=1 Tax=Candidatus Woesebacteria bacterium RIFCSPHIGHO2_02_FULL_39_13 TaxID=1802505 RepID=A0A1F7Z537_9BACT|nr:MAG: hypothetical protein A2692_04415 [Candidatus Woesebacteria bacterium RIFCSPHIGHO2_01_FULL_39_95]OGM33855.1 MAG: hypothetical protein A3D01_02700 [Candidatus Woesebacteria bacterium RIFCSPHIGHO2_02_FULL_39_13]OGM39016.1 MAG: hypothetical protein A3E13_04970 [Candidatus Woesebacteria bacterium RIFCSPHIGHO2_12_FULL_40_20]OGM67521.1 MAG: hypothetical protein A2962_03330 [Candidatus Woesebacteria bacterium RIFCSPLOWO2_01_FULL_39_61]OGM72852.1 MAG: hypothetical protein A3H19_05835 [Candidatus